MSAATHTSNPPSSADGSLFRFVMVLAGMAPLFGLWAMRGAPVAPGWEFRVICLALALIPNALVFWRIRKRRGRKYGHELEVGSFEDKRDGVLTYFVAVLLPFYSSSLETWPELCASMAAVIFILAVFMYLNLHYVNVLFALRGYNIYFVQPMESEERRSAKRRVILVTKEPDLRVGDQLSVTSFASGVVVERSG